ncbi:MAG: alpha/beta hydrolase [Chthoniobacterales bacterium]
MDTILYGMMNWIHWKLRRNATTKELLEAYLDACTPLSRERYFLTEPMEEVTLQTDRISWKSPHQDSYIENNQAQALFFPAFSGDRCAPTLIILHALMSVNDRGYRRIAKKMNAQGWNVLLPHLPFHYSRCPEKHSSGSLAITADLVRNGETLRQAVKEIRQLMHWSKAQGSSRIGLLATSYGGWIASLIMSLEPVDFAILLQPIVDINHAMFQSPLSRIMAYLLTSRGITAEHLHRHAHLTAPQQGLPQCLGERLMIIGGTFDKISPPHHLRNCCEKWNGALYHEVPQGHFGFRAMKLALELMDKFI